jgi:hypothetical protein
MKTVQWYAPDGEAIVIAPSEVQDYRTDVVTPAFSSPGLWRDPHFVFPYWAGTDPIRESRESQNLFLAGLLFGVAGSAFIAGIQEGISHYRSRRKGPA